MKNAKYLFWLIALIPIFLMRDVAKGNELTYLSIAEQALRNGNFFAFYNHGAIYADKPPLYIWLVMLGERFWNGHCMIWMGLFSLIPSFLILHIMDKWTTPIIDKDYRSAGQWLLLTTGMFLSATIVIRMDMLMTLFIVLSLYTFYKMYTEGITRKRRVLLPLYIFLALFTKGPFGLLIPLLSIFFFLLIEKRGKEIKRYLGWTTWSILFGLSAIWLFMVYSEGGSVYLNNLLFHQTVGRAFGAFIHRNGFFYYFVTLPYSMAPWIILYIYVIWNGIQKKRLIFPLQRFFLTITTVTFILLSCVSSKIEIYLLPAYPFIVFLCASLMRESEKDLGVFIGLIAPAFGYCLALPTMIFFKVQHLLLNWQTPFMFAASAIVSLVGLVTVVQLIKDRNRSCNGAMKPANTENNDIWNRYVCKLSVAPLFALMIASGSLPKVNVDIGYSRLSEEIRDISQQNDVHFYCCYHVKNGSALDYYLHTPIVEIPKHHFEQVKEIHKPYILVIPTKYLYNEQTINNYLNYSRRYQDGPYELFICR
jgi:4-amino-4-deoxy-L-arabinose transferase-like glycosyltransferase